MQTTQWTLEFITIIFLTGLVFAGTGYLLAMVLQGRKISELQAQLQQQQQLHAQQQQQIEQAGEQNRQYQSELQQFNTALHEKEVSESRLQSDLRNASDHVQRLNREQAESKDALTIQQQALEQSRQQYHDTEKRLETVQTKNQAQIDQINELRERLAATEGLLEQERAYLNELKNTLAEEGKKAEGLEKTLEQMRLHFRAQKESLDQQSAVHDALQKDYRQLDKTHAELKTTLQQREEHFTEQMQQLSDTRQSLTKEFENLANKIFEQKGKTFAHTSQSSIDTLLKPFREQIEGFQKRINEVHDASLKGNTSLNAEIKKVLDIGLQMSQEANNLTSALKGDSQQRGAWGEAQLRRTLEMSGLIEDAHYDVQSTFKDTEGKKKQTDYLIKLPDGKHIIIDSKVALNAYDRAVAAESSEEYQIAMSDHAKAVRNHIDDLASKDYASLAGMGSPSFVLMFMPVEPAYIEALKNNKDLFEYGYKKGIVLVSHTTLIPILRTVSNLWMIERSNAEAREISEKAGDIYNQVCLVAERLSKLGGTLNTVSNHYNSTVKALAGQQGLYGKVDRFSQLSAKVSKTLPQLEASHIDFETERLSLIVEPVEEPEAGLVESQLPVLEATEGRENDED